MNNQISSSEDYAILRPPQSQESTIFLLNLKNGIWLLGILAWLFAVTDRTTAGFTDGSLSAIELLHLTAISLLFLGWLCLKPEKSTHTSHTSSINSQVSLVNQPYLALAAKRMSELEPQHLIRQEYSLPFPQICQIYHLLNLKHLENVHSFSLNNLRVVQVSHCEPTSIGGKVKFQTMLDSPFNVLRIWRQPIVEVDLTLHSPYTVELSIPVYNEKRITVLFNALPTSETEHQLLIDIYSDLQWPKPLLQPVLHLASCLTLYEDLPYLRHLATRKLDRLVTLSRLPSHETMWLFRRFVTLYGNSLVSAPVSSAIAPAL